MGVFAHYSHGTDPSIKNSLETLLSNVFLTPADVVWGKERVEEEEEEGKEAQAKEVGGNGIYETLGRVHTIWDKIQTSDKVGETSNAN